MGLFIDSKSFVLVLLAGLIQRDLDDAAESVVLGDEVQNADHFEVGMRVERYIDDTALMRSRVRQVADVLNNSVHDLYGVDDGVTAWVDGLGGLRKVDELFVGHDALKQYIHDMREIKSVDGYVPTLGGRNRIEGVDSATSYDSYAVLAHREVLTKKAYGEMDDEENSPSSPSWEGHESNIGSQWVGGKQSVTKPFWWDRIYLGRFRAGKRSDGKNGLIQVPHSTGKDWVTDLRVSKSVDETNQFTPMCTMAAWCLVEENPVVKEFTDRFYNNPNSLFWFKTGEGEKQRWAAGMSTPKGFFLWSPVTHESSKTIDWWLKNEGKEQKRWYSRALYFGPWVISYRKVKDQIEVRMFKECSQTGWLSLWKTTLMDWQDWGKEKKSLLKRGAKDAYFGKPWQPAEYKRQETSNKLDIL